MPDDDEWTPGDVTSMIANPFYAINIDDGLAVPHEPLITEDNWVGLEVLVDCSGLHETDQAPGEVLFLWPGGVGYGVPEIPLDPGQDGVTDAVAADALGGHQGRCRPTRAHRWSSGGR